MSAARSRLALVLCLAAMAAWVSVGCDHHGEPGHAHDEHGNHPPPDEQTAQVTVWGERHEIFLEHPFIVAGQPVRFVTHVTDLETLEPRREGSATFVLQLGSEPPITQVEAAPARAGIYIPELTFPKAGQWAVSIKVPVENGESVVKLPPFAVYASKEEAAQAPEVESPEGISFLKEQQWKILTRTDPVGRRKLVERIRLAGVSVPAPGFKAAITPSLAGQLLPPEGGSLPSVGSVAKSGQVLARVQPPLAGSDLLTVASSQFQIKAMEMEFAVKYAEVEANEIRGRVAVEQAGVALERVKKLYSENAKSQRELEEAQFALRTAEAHLASAVAMKKIYDQAKERLASIPQSQDLEGGFPAVELKAPISGVITQVTAAVGEHVGSDKAVFTILDLSKVHIEARVPESQMPRLAEAKGAAYQLPGTKGQYVAALADGGRLAYVGQEVDVATRTIPLVYEVPNPGGQLKAGMALDLYVETKRAEDALAIPESALVDEDGRPVAFVMLSGETFEKRELTLGIRDSGYVQVLGGLAEGERIVTKGAYAVRLASVSTSIPAHGHAH